MLICHSGPTAGDVEVLAPRLVPLGGPRAMSVRRTLPARGRRLIGAWCFLDHYGPADTGVVGMDVPPHPHIGLQTVTWIFGGTIAHRDSLGSVQEVGPGQLSLMTAGRGIAHSERSVPRVGSSTLRGVQLWVVCPSRIAAYRRAMSSSPPRRPWWCRGRAWSS